MFADALDMRTARFTFLHGLLLSIALHAAVALPLVIALKYVEDLDDETLLVEFQGLDSNIQTEEQERQQDAGTSGRGENSSESTGAERVDAKDKPEKEQSEEDAIPAPVEQKQISGAASSEAAGRAGAAPTQGGEQQQSAQTFSRQAEQQMTILRDYVKGLSKKIQSKLIYPKEGRRAGLQGVTTVSFRILTDGAMNPDSLRIVESSGKAELDASALRTVHACAPFSPPPKEITVTMAVTYGRKR